MILTGQARLGRDVSVKYTPSGTAIAELAAVYSYGIKPADGYKPSQWITATVFGKQAEALGRFFLKGSVWNLTLRNVRIDTWDKKDGSQGFKLVGDVVDIDFGMRGGDDNGAQEPRHAPQNPQQSAQAPQARPSLADMDGEDLPF